MQLRLLTLALSTAVLVTSERFWLYSDQINTDHVQRDGIAAGLFDYNRLNGL